MAHGPETWNDRLVRARLRHWLVDGVVGVVLGGLVGAVIAVNVVIFSGIEGGYEASLAEVFRVNVLVGFIVVALLAAGPVVGVIGARRMRRRRTRVNGR